jgi:hypothetical protein
MLLTVFFAGLLSNSAVGVASNLSNEPQHLLSQSFPGSVQVDSASFEFCPDNTCDFIEARKSTPMEAILDFGFLYVYFFSDFYVLKDWRIKDEPTVTSKAILEKLEYMSCKQGSDQEKALCILRKLSKDYQIQIYDVRYDEKERNTVRKKLP